jgi:hypothetical protein
VVNGLQYQPVRFSKGARNRPKPRRRPPLWSRLANPCMKLTIIFCDVMTDVLVSKDEAHSSPKSSLRNMLTGSHTVWLEEVAAREIARIGVDQEWILAPVVCAVVSETNLWFHDQKENIFI